MSDDDTPTVTLKLSLDKDDLREVVREELAKRDRKQAQEYRVDKKLR